MKNISNEMKKELFKSIVEKKKNGTLHDFIGGQSQEYDDILSRLYNNHGPFGVLLNDIDEEGKISVLLSQNLYKHLPTELLGYPYPVLKFEEAELDAFLDRFYDMNNMEILNEFCKQREDKDKASLERFKVDRFSYNTFASLNVIDYLSGQGMGDCHRNGDDNYSFDRGVNLYLSDENFSNSENNILTIESGDGILRYNINTNEIIEKEGSNLDQYIGTISKAIADIPTVYEKVLSGEYKKEDFGPNTEKDSKEDLGEDIE